MKMVFCHPIWRIIGKVLPLALVLLLILTSGSLLSAQNPPSPTGSTVALKWMDFGQDRMSPGETKSNNALDGHFQVILNVNGNKAVKRLYLYTSDSSGNPAGGQSWDSSGWWMLGVFRNGVDLNPLAKALNDPVAGQVTYDVFGNDSGYFKSGQYFGINVDFTDDTQLKALTVIGAVASPVGTTSTFGLNTGDSQNIPVRLNGLRFPNTCGTGTLTKLELLFNTSNPSGKVRMGVYADNNGKPGALLLDAGETTVRNGWTAISGLSLPVQANAYYWLSFIQNGSNPVVFSSTDTYSNYFVATSYGPLPSSYPGGYDTNVRCYAMRATVESAGAGPAVSTGTFGLNTGGSQNVPVHLNGLRFPNTCGTGILTKLELLFNTSNPSGKVRMGVYADNDGRPGSLLLDAGEATVVNGWTSISGLSLPVQANINYWLSFIQSGSNPVVFSSTDTHSDVWVDQSYGPLPSSFPTLYESNIRCYVMRATVSISSPPSSSPSSSTPSTSPAASPSTSAAPTTSTTATPTASVPPATTPATGAVPGKTYGSSQNEVGYAVVQTSDGGYMIAGGASANKSDKWDAWLLKTDINGNKLWDKTFGSANTSEEFFSVAKTPEGDYILGGYTQKGDEWRDLWVVRMDSQGNKIWDKTFGGTQSDWARSIIQTSDGNYLIAGTTSSYGVSSIIGTVSNIWLLKIDADGNKLWDKAIGSEDLEHGLTVIQSGDGGYVIAEDHPGEVHFETHLIKTDNNGNILWNTYVYDESNATSIIQAPDGGFVIAGQVISGNNRYLRIVKVNSSGNIVWSSEPLRNLYPEAVYDINSPMIQDSDGGYVVAGIVSKLGSGGYDLWLIKTDANGNLLWNKTFGGAKDDIANSIILSSDGNYVIVGSTTQTESDNMDLWLLKVKS